MNFIKKMILDAKQKKQLEKERELKASCSRYMFSIENNIDLLKIELEHFKQHKGKLDYSTSRDFVSMLSLIQANYYCFLDDLRYTEYAYNSTYYKNVKEDLKPKIEYMHQKKKEYRAEFESIYRNFKRVSKGAEFPNRNEIIRLMRTAFDFDSSKYHQEENSQLML